MEVGDVISVLNAGAYATSMSSNYNLFKRPNEIFLENGKSRVIKREESLNDM